MSVNSHLIANNPVWTSNTLATAVSAAGAPVAAQIPLMTASGPTSKATTVIVSNTGPVNLFIGTLSVPAILLQPGAAITLAVGNGQPYVHDTVGTGTWAVVAYE
tara:strand:+ start:49 stop:360 length:312 start_codon:yes stop_codon:yes gene_type:complete